MAAGWNERNVINEKNELTERSTTTSTYYHTCPHCGAHLDPGEKCDCSAGARGVYTAFIHKALNDGRVPGILKSFCWHALEDSSTPDDTLRTLCSKIKEYDGNNA